MPARCRLGGPILRRGLQAAMLTSVLTRRSPVGGLWVRRPPSPPSCRVWKRQLQSAAMTVVVARQDISYNELGGRRFKSGSQLKTVRKDGNPGVVAQSGRAPDVICSHPLVWPRRTGSQPDNPGSNPGANATRRLTADRTSDRVEVHRFRHNIFPRPVAQQTRSKSVLRQSNTVAGTGVDTPHSRLLLSGWVGAW